MRMPPINGEREIRQEHPDRGLHMMANRVIRIDLDVERRLAFLDPLPDICGLDDDLLRSGTSFRLRLGSGSRESEALPRDQKPDQKQGSHGSLLNAADHFPV